MKEVKFDKRFLGCLLYKKKTETRRPIRNRGPLGEAENWVPLYLKRPEVRPALETEMTDNGYSFCPWGKIGDIVYAREDVYLRRDVSRENPKAENAFYYSKMNTKEIPDRRYELFQAKDAPLYTVRFFFEITNIRIEKLGQINDQSINLEGYMHDDREAAKKNFVVDWNTFYKDTPFDYSSNPYVWVISFRKLSLADDIPYEFIKAEKQARVEAWASREEAEASREEAEASTYKKPIALKPAQDGNNYYYQCQVFNDLGQRSSVHFFNVYERVSAFLDKNKYKDNFRIFEREGLEKPWELIEPYAETGEIADVFDASYMLQVPTGIGINEIFYYYFLTQRDVIDFLTIREKEKPGSFYTLYRRGTKGEFKWRKFSSGNYRRGSAFILL